MTGEEMERAIDFLLRSQANLGAGIEQVNENLGSKIEELTQVVRMQADSQGQFNQTVTTAITALAEAQAKTEAKVDRLADVVGQLAERLAGVSKMSEPTPASAELAQSILEQDGDPFVAYLAATIGRVMSLNYDGLVDIFGDATTSRRIALD